ncbi:hypothetical protein A0H81_10505 [Grifola frondosa]|uniref:Uncharacterized protein n=1 Tax=Grifola frondosa TaxID=5627 RepID=A0A1C7LZ58_GRIFR|nr:hypothetical protein A0H81_10505 [Grifola frondosa]
MASSFNVFTRITHVAYNIVAQIELSRQASTTTTIDFSRNSTLTAARRLSRSLPPSATGMLSFASPKKLPNVHSPVYTVST